MLGGLLFVVCVILQFHTITTRFRGTCGYLHWSHCLFPSANQL